MYSIMIADDQKAICDSLLSFLKHEFPSLYCLGTYYNGNDLFHALTEQLPDILITDIRMPGRSGLEICQYIRGHSKTTQIILISGYQEFEYARTALEYQVLQYLVKPYSTKKLFRAIQYAISNLEQFEKSKPVLADYDSIPGAIKAYIEKSFAYPELSTSYIASTFNLSNNYANDLFRKQYNMTITEYVNDYRIKKACEMLSSSSTASLEEISIATGYNSQAYFNRVFKNHMGVTPSEYRRGKKHNG